MDVKKENNMLSKNNFKERLRKMEDRQDRLSIRKFSIEQFPC